MNEEPKYLESVDELSEEMETKLFKELELTPEQIRAYHESKTSRPVGPFPTLEEIRAQVAAWPKRRAPLRTIKEEEEEEARRGEG